MSLATGALQAVLTVTDGDGDIATSAADLGGGVIRFEDDGPTAGLTVQAGATVVVDESIGQNAGETEGGAAGLGQVTVLGDAVRRVAGDGPGQ